MFLIGIPVRDANKLTTCFKSADKCENDPAIEQALLMESSVYDDLVTTDFIDIYQNLTLKTIAMLKWAVDRCPKAKFLLKLDDDVSVNIPVLQNIFNNWQQTNVENLWAGIRMTYKAIRSHAYNIVSYDQYPNNDYPYYASGPRYGIKYAHFPDILAVIHSFTFAL